MVRVVVTGGAGQLARAVAQTWTGMELIVPDESVLDLASAGSIRRVIREAKPDIVFNAAAFTAVDRCETEPGFAYDINGMAVGRLAGACSEQGALLVHISTDYVFDGLGTRPYREDDPTGPRSVYGKSKLLGEEQARLAEEHLIVRTAWLYDIWGKNIYNTMLNAAAQDQPLRVVDDQVGSPTTCRALARQIKIAVEERWRGTVHCTCSGATTWHGFAAAIFQKAGMRADLNPCLTSAYPLPAPRPAYSVLDGAKRALLGTDVMPPWGEALDEVIRARNSI